MAVVVFCTQLCEHASDRQGFVLLALQACVGIYCVITGVALVTVKPLFNVHDFRIGGHGHVAGGGCRRRSMLTTTVALVGEFTSPTPR